MADDPRYGTRKIENRRVGIDRRKHESWEGGPLEPNRDRRTSWPGGGVRDRKSQRKEQ